MVMYFIKTIEVSTTLVLLLNQMSLQTPKIYLSESILLCWHYLMTLSRSDQDLKQTKQALGVSVWLLQSHVWNNGRETQSLAVLCITDTFL